MRVKCNDSIFIVFFLGIVFAPVCPLMIPLMFILAIFGFFTYKYLAVYCDIRQVDSGGVYWQVAVQHLAVCVFVMELTVFGVLSTKASFFQLLIYAPVLVYTYYRFDEMLKNPWDHLCPFDVVDETVAPPAPREHENLQSLFALNPSILRHHMQGKLRSCFQNNYVQPALRSQFHDNEKETHKRDKSKIFGFVQKEVQQVNSPGIQYVQQSIPVLGPWMGPDGLPIPTLWDSKLQPVMLFVGIHGQPVTENGEVVDVQYGTDGRPNGYRIKSGVFFLFCSSSFIVFSEFISCFRISKGSIQLYTQAGRGKLRQ